MYQQSLLELQGRRLAAIAAGIGTVVLCGWLLGIESLRKLSWDAVGMKFNASLCLVLSGIALLWRDRRAKLALWLAVLFIAGATLYEWVSGADFGIDNLFVADPGDPGTSIAFPGRMSPQTAAAMLLMALSEVVRFRSERWKGATNGVLVLIVLMALTSLSSHFFGLTNRDSLWGLTQMAVPTGAAILLLALSCLLSRPGDSWIEVLASQSLAGKAARQGLPIVLGAPLFANALRSAGERFQLFDHTTGLYLLITGGSALLLVASAAAIMRLQRLEDQRAHTELELAASREMETLRRNFLSAVSHELRSPIGAIELMAGFIGSHLEKRPQDEKIHEYLTRILGSTKRLSAFVDDILLLAEIEHGKITLTHGPVRIQDIARELTKGCLKQARLLGIRMDNRIAADLPAVLGDSPRLSRVLAQLLSNALKFTPSGGEVRLSSRLAGAGGSMVEISVADTGAGLSETELRGLFQAFRQGENIQNRHGDSPQGTGIGLYVSKAIVAAHGGRIFAQSTPGHGTTVSFTLPMAPAARTSVKSSL